MTDIVARLRSGKDCGDPCLVREARSGCLCAAAADEIEKLRIELNQCMTVDDIGRLIGKRGAAHDRYR